MTEKPQLDPIKTADLIAVGCRLYAAQSDDPPEMRHAIWCLLQEAANTMRFMSRGAPKSAGSAWPDILKTAGEIEAIYNERLTEIRNAEKEGRTPDHDLASIDIPSVRAPSPGAVERFLPVMQWLRFIRCRSQKQQRMRLILALAMGMGPQRATEVFTSLNFGTRQAVDAAKKRALNDIEREIKAACPRIYATAAA